MALARAKKNMKYILFYGPFDDYGKIVERRPVD